MYCVYNEMIMILSTIFDLLSYANIRNVCVAVKYF